MNVKKTLLVCDSHPLPSDDGNKVRTLNFVRFFGTLGTIDAVYDYKPSQSGDGDSIFRHEYLIEKRKHSHDLTGRLRMFMKGIPYPVREYLPGSRKLIASLIDTHDYDYIVVRYVRNTNFLFGLPERYQRQIIIDFDDVFSGASYYPVLFYESSSPYKMAIRRLNRSLLVHYEKKCFHTGFSLFCSEKDRSAFEENKRAFVVPNVYENETFANFDFGDGRRLDNILLFVGSLFYSPNVQGLIWFIENVFPAFQKRYADARLLVVGRNPGEELKNLCSRTQGISLYPDVADMKEYYQKARAVVVPLLSGGGTRIKILEAALAGRPVLSTPVGAEGLDLENGRDLFLFRDSKEFLLGYEKLADEAEYNSIVSNAKEFVLRNYSMHNFSEALGKVLHEVDKFRT